MRLLERVKGKVGDDTDAEIENAKETTVVRERRLKLSDDFELQTLRQHTSPQSLRASN